MVTLIVELFRSALRLFELSQREEDTSAQERYELLRIQTLATDELAKRQLRDDT